MKASAFRTSLPLLLIGLATRVPVTTALTNDFSAYPQGSQQCLSDSADQSKCSGNTGKQLNTCLCSNQGNFIYDTATCVSKNSPNDLNAVYDTMQNNCAGTGVQIAVSKQAFLSQANAATATTSGTPTTTNGPGATSTADASRSVLSKGAKIGIGVGVSFGIIALGLLAWFIWLYSRRRQRHPQSPTNSTGPDVELYNNNNGHANSTASGYPSPAPEYAQHNGQFGVAELAPAERRQHEWKELPAESAYYDAHSPAKSASDSSYKHTSGEPLLNRAELGSDEATTPVHPVELPAEVVYSDASSARSPDGGYRDRENGHGRGGG